MTRKHTDEVALEESQNRWKLSAMAISEANDRLSEENARLREQLKAANSQTEEFERKWYLLANEVYGLIEESDGVYGLHLNGDASPWRELLPGGQFERITALPTAVPEPKE